MRFDKNLVTGIVLGAVIALHYHAMLATYLPILTVVAVVLLIRIAIR